MSDDIYRFIVDDDDGSVEGGCGASDDEMLDTQWIRDYENDILVREYELFLKSDIARVSFQFIYLDRDKKCVQFVIPMMELYSLKRVNQITQAEIFQIIYRHQNVKKKYYNFHSLLLYDFHLEDGNRSVAEYISSSPGGGDELDFGRIIEYTNILSFETIYFRPLIAMFHGLIGFTVVLYED
jgi:hypothetical protein